MGGKPVVEVAWLFSLPPRPFLFLFLGIEIKYIIINILYNKIINNKIKKKIRRERILFFLCSYFNFQQIAQFQTLEYILPWLYIIYIFIFYKLNNGIIKLIVIILIININFWSDLLIFIFCQ